MKPYLSLLLVLALLCSLAACGSSTEANDNAASPPVSDSVATPEVPDKPTETVGAGRILIAYFTYGENAPLADGVDASSSASIQYRDDGSITGNTGIVADMIAEATGGDLFSILTAEPYPDSYDATVDVGQEEKSAGTHPQLVSHMENLADYDTIFLGFPNWWYGMPMAVYSFLEEYDFSGKTIVPFVTSGGSGFSDSIREIQQAEPGATVLEGLSIGSGSATSAQVSVAEWLDGLFD